MKLKINLIATAASIVALATSCAGGAAINTVTIPLTGNEIYQTVIPVSINGKTFNFLWDTGTCSSIISQTAMRELGIDTINKYAITRQLHEKQVSRAPYADWVDLKLGDLAFKAQLLVPNNYVFDSSIFNTQGIIGSDIINLYSWLFDFERQTVTISNKKQCLKINDQNQKYNFGLFFSDTIAKTRPYLKMKINDTIQELILLDTGFSILEPVSFLGVNLNVDVFFLMSDSTSPYHLRTYIDKKYATNNTIFTSAKNPLISAFLEDLTINGYDPTILVLGFEHDKFYGNYYTEVEYGDGLKGGIVIGANFLKRFSRMYYDAKASSVSLIISASDTTVYGKREIDKYSEALEKLAPTSTTYTEKQK